MMAHVCAARQDGLGGALDEEGVRVALARAAHAHHLALPAEFQHAHLRAHPFKRESWLTVPAHPLAQLLRCMSQHPGILAQRATSHAMPAILEVRGTS